MVQCDVWNCWGRKQNIVHLVRFNVRTGFGFTAAGRVEFQWALNAMGGGVGLICKCLLGKKQQISANVIHRFLGKYQHQMKLFLKSSFHSFKCHIFWAMALKDGYQDNQCIYLVNEEPVVIVDWGEDKHPCNCLWSYPEIKWNDFLWQETMWMKITVTWRFRGRQ